MMKASVLEYRLRYLLYGVIYALGFYAPWERYTSFTLGSRTLWLLLAAFPAQQHLLSFTASSQSVLILSCVAATLGAVLRVWGASYLGAAIVHSSALHGKHVVTGGPFRYVRNPLYLGAFLTSIALLLLMPPTGAIVAFILIVFLQIRLIGAEEAFLGQCAGEPYRLYRTQVSRFLPTLRPRVPLAENRADYRSGILSEVFVIGCAISFLAVGWNFNSTLLLKGVLISLGVSLIASAFIPKATPPAGDLSADHSAS